MMTTDVGEAPHPLLSFLFGIGCFVYQTMDNMDGKQARRTLNSTPLGMLFDHGCDAINCFVQAMTFARIMMFGPFMTGVCFTLPFIMFYLATFETYSTGSLVLGEINSPNEGILTVAGLSIFSALVGSGYWAETSFFGCNRSLPIVLGIMAFSGKTAQQQYFRSF